VHLWSYLAHFLLQWEMVHIKVVEKFKTHILGSITSPPPPPPPPPLPENRTVRKIMWKILYSRTGHRGQYGACALHTGYLKLQTHTYCSSTKKTVAQTHLSLPLYVQCLSCWHLSLYLNDLTDCTWNYERNMTWGGTESSFSEHWCFNYFFVEDFLKAMFLTREIFYSSKSNK